MPFYNGNRPVSMNIHYPVTTLDGQILLSAGAVLDNAALDRLLDAAPPADLKKYALVDHGTVLQDIRGILATPPYDIIFSDKTAFSEIFDVIRSVRFAAPVLEVLEYFKTNDWGTYRHMLAIFALTTLIARDLVPNYREKVSEIAHGPTHDFGKICIPLEILKKDIALTREESDYPAALPARYCHPDSLR